MAAIGSVWATGSWADDVWADDTWAGAVVPQFWTPVTTASGSWAPVSAESGTWTPVVQVT